MIANVNNPGYLFGVFHCKIFVFLLEEWLRNG